jgi:hypothetical protein
MDAVRVCGEVTVVRKILSLSLVLAFVSVCAGAAETEQAKKPTKHVAQKKSTANRSLASLAPVAKATSQGEEMLNEVKVSSPGFLAKGPRNTARVNLAGVCRDEHGMAYNSFQKGYGDCLDPKTGGGTGDSYSGYFGPAQRQTGFGILVR